MTDLIKAVTSTDTNSFELEHFIPELQRSGPVRPKLFTAMFGGGEDIYLNTDRVEWDLLEETMQMPAGKRYDQHGPRLTRDKAKDISFRVPAFGLTYESAPATVAGKRVAGTVNDFETMAADLGRLALKADRAWMNFEEYQIAKVITSDSMDYLGGSYTSYDYYDLFKGGTRVITYTDAAGVNDNFEQRMLTTLTELEEEAEKQMVEVSSWKVVCGKNFFNAVMQREQLDGLAREIKGELDLAQEEIPYIFDGSSKVRIRNFTNKRDGLDYILYNASVYNGAQIGDDEAYMVPVGVGAMFKRFYAPNKTKSAVNTTAQSVYTYAKSDEFKGDVFSQMKNELIVNPYPSLIRKLDIAESA